MEINSRRKFLLSEEKVSKALVLLAVPSIIAMLTTALYNFVDTLFVSMLKSTAMIAAVTVSFPMVMIMSAIGQGIGIGAGSLISRQLGKKDYGSVERSVFTGMLMAIVFSALGMALLIGNLPTILPWFGATPDALDYSVRYAMWMIIGMSGIVLNMTMNNILRAEGDVKFPMFAIMLGALLNIILDPIFMFDWGLNLGLDGAAIATIVSQYISTAVLVLRLTGKDTVVRWKITRWLFDIKIAYEIFALGIALFFRQALVSFSMMFINSAAANYGTNLVAAIGLAMRTMMIINYVLIGYAQGFQPFAGYNYGAKNFGRLKESLSLSIRWSTMFLTAMTLMLVLFARPIMSIFTDSEEVIYYGSRMFYAICLALPFMGFYQIHMVLFQSLGKAKEAFILSVARQGIFFLPMILILPRFFEYNGILAAQPAADLLTVLLTAVFSIRLKKEFEF
jgi:putative MATE family efflux protein